MKKAFLASALLVVTSASMATTEKLDAQWVVSSVETTEVSSGSSTNGVRSGYQDDYYYRKGSTVGGDVAGTAGGYQEPAPTRTFDDRVQTTGKVVQTLRDVVALGEELYNLVQKGKPSNTTEYAPISVLPKAAVNGVEVQWDELENFSMPIEKKYTTVIKDGNGKEAVRFEYMIIFSYGGSYNGAGKYLAGIEIIPISVKTTYGWDFNATMKLGGIMNNGTKADPVAGANITIKYQMKSWRTTFERNDLIYITGHGEIKSYSR